MVERGTRTRGEFDRKACDSCDAVEIMLGKSGEVLLTKCKRRRLNRSRWRGVLCRSAFQVTSRLLPTLPKLSLR